MKKHFSWTQRLPPTWTGWGSDETSNMPESHSHIEDKDELVSSRASAPGDEWSLTELREVCMKIGSGATPRGGKEVYLEYGPYTLIRSQNVYNYGFQHGGLAFIGERHAEELRNVEVFDEDVLLNITGDSVARVCQVAADVLPARVNQHVAIIRPDPTKLDPGFLRYYLTSTEMQTTLLSWAGSGGTRNALTKGMLESLEVPLPPLTEQQAIAHVLGTLDDKIELNRRMNRTLEQMARAIFQDWFVDFGPTRAKTEGQEPYLPPELWDLFPDELADSELGEIPEGWEVKTLSEFASLNPESWSKSSLPYEIEYVDLANTKWGTITSTQHFPRESAPSRARRVLRVGDTIIGTVRPGNGSFSLVGRDSLTGSTGFAALRPKHQQFRELIYLAASHPDNIERLSSRADGAAYPAVRPEVVVETSVVTPNGSAHILQYFSNVVRPAIDKIEENNASTRTMTAMRNELLPLLMSGELKLE